MKIFLKTQKDKILYRNKTHFLKGVNLGGWLMMEAYILHAPNFAEQKFKALFRKKLGERQLKNFEKQFRDNFIKVDDIKNIKKLGLNCLRLPFHYSLIEKKPYRYDQKGLAYIDKVIRWAKEQKIWIILDLHGACGCQNHDWHSDSTGDAKLWSVKSYQHRTFALWEFLADRYKDEEYIAGYDLLNEAVLNDTRKLNTFYKNVIQCIRKVDKNHILFIEGNKWSTDLKCLDVFEDDNYALSIHNYEPLDFTFNFVLNLTYPIRGKSRKWDKGITKALLSQYKRISQKRSVPIFVGEFGVNVRSGKIGEGQWLKETLSCFKQFGFHWTFWTYKTIKNNIFPDGIYTYNENPPWVNRSGPLAGWDTFAYHWPTKSKEMCQSWCTKNFEENKVISKVLREYAR